MEPLSTVTCKSKTQAKHSYANIIALTLTIHGAIIWVSTYNINLVIVQNNVLCDAKSLFPAAVWHGTRLQHTVKEIHHTCACITKSKLACHSAERLYQYSCKQVVFFLLVQGSQFGYLRSVVGGDHSRGGTVGYLWKVLDLFPCLCLCPQICLFWGCSGIDGLSWISGVWFLIKFWDVWVV